jgi:hypothetical protein
MNDTILITPADVAAKAYANIRSWKAYGIRSQALALEVDPTAADYIIDLMADTTVSELDPETLNRLISASTADNLALHGYQGARSNGGVDITPFFTVLLYAVKREFGDDAVRLGTWVNKEIGGNYRGIRNTSEVRKFYSEETTRLIRRLLTNTYAEGEHETEYPEFNPSVSEGNRRHITLCRAGKAEGVGQHIFNQLKDGLDPREVVDLDGKPANMNTILWYKQFI